MVFLEDLIINQLRLNLPENIHILGSIPIDSDTSQAGSQNDLIQMSLQPTPAVHIYEKSFAILNDDVLKRQNDKIFNIKKSKQVWIIIIVKNAYELQNSPEYAYKELEKIKCLIQRILTYWNPNELPFTVPLSWNPELIENLYNPGIGYVYCPMILETSRPYYEIMERINGN